MIRRILAYTLALALPATGLAQTLTGVKVEPAEIKAGDSAKITVSFSAEDSINCGLRLHFGDGVPGNYKINQQKDLNLVVTRAYPKAGDYRIMAEPKTVGLLLKCGGKNQTAMLRVGGPSAGASKAAAAAGPQCPEGWTLDSKSVRKKTGAFTCQGKPGTKPSRSLTCPEDLSYFENQRKGLAGCRP